MTGRDARSADGERGCLLEYLASVGPKIDAHLHRYLTAVPKGSALDRYLYGILDEFIMRGGKRMRPAMAMLACEAAGDDPLRALASGCAIEVFHAAALIHDDIMDGSLLRRGAGVRAHHARRASGHKRRRLRSGPGLHHGGARPGS